LGVGGGVGGAPPPPPLEARAAGGPDVGTMVREASAKRQRICAATLHCPRTSRSDAARSVPSMFSS
jgi:hypothetical protein